MDVILVVDILGYQLVSVRLDIAVWISHIRFLFVPISAINITPKHQTWFAGRILVGYILQGVSQDPYCGCNVWNLGSLSYGIMNITTKGSLAWKHSMANFPLKDWAWIRNCTLFVSHSFLFRPQTNKRWLLSTSQPLTTTKSAVVCSFSEGQSLGVRMMKTPPLYIWPPPRVILMW
mgnify:CR=1 FL=1